MAKLATTIAQMASRLIHLDLKFRQISTDFYVESLDSCSNASGVINNA